MAVVLAGRCCLDVYRLKQVQIKIIVVISFIAPAAASVKHRSGVRPSVFPVGRILTATYHLSLTRGQHRRGQHMSRPSLFIWSDLIFSCPRSEGWPHHGRTFSIYPCPLSFCSTWCLHFHGESCPRLDVVHPGRAWPSSPACTWHCSLHYLFLQATPSFPQGVTIVCYLTCFDGV